MCINSLFLASNKRIPSLTACETPRETSRFTFERPGTSHACLAFHVLCFVHLLKPVSSKVGDPACSETFGSPSREEAEKGRARKGKRGLSLPCERASEPGRAPSRVCTLGCATRHVVETTSVEGRGTRKAERGGVSRWIGGTSPVLTSSHSLRR